MPETGANRAKSPFGLRKLRKSRTNSPAPRHRLGASSPASTDSREHDDPTRHARNRPLPARRVRRVLRTSRVPGRRTARQGWPARAIWLESTEPGPPSQVHLMYAEGARPGGGHFALVCPDYDATIARLRAAGHDVDPRREHWGSPRSYVRDPAGNLVELMATRLGAPRCQPITNRPVDLGRLAWLATVLACLIAVLILVLQGVLRLRGGDPRVARRRPRSTCRLGRPRRRPTARGAARSRAAPRPAARGPRARGGSARRRPSSFCRDQVLELVGGPVGVLERGALRGTGRGGRRTAASRPGACAARGSRPRLAARTLRSRPGSRRPPPAGAPRRRAPARSASAAARR